MRLGDEPGPGVGERRGAGIADKRDVLALAKRVDQLGRSRAFVMLVQRYRAGVDAVPREQRAAGARVLAGDEVGGAQGIDGARARVGEVADRRRHHVERPGQPAAVPIR